MLQDSHIVIYIQTKVSMNFQANGNCLKIFSPKSEKLSFYSIMTDMFADQNHNVCMSMSYKVFGFKNWIILF